MRGEAREYFHRGREVKEYVSLLNGVDGQDAYDHNSEATMEHTPYEISTFNC